MSQQNVPAQPAGTAINMTSHRHGLVPDLMAAFVDGGGHRGDGHDRTGSEAAAGFSEDPQPRELTLRNQACLLARVPWAIPVVVYATSLDGETSRLAHSIAAFLTSNEYIVADVGIQVRPALATGSDLGLLDQGNQTHLFVHPNPRSSF